MNDLRNDDPNFDVMGNFDHGLTLALSKGRILKETLPLLENAGINLLEDPDKSRKLIFPTTHKKVRILILRASDVPTYVENGAADFGVAGKDVLMEHGAQHVYELLDLKIANCKLQIAAMRFILFFIAFFCILGCFLLLFCRFLKFSVVFRRFRCQKLVHQYFSFNRSKPILRTSRCLLSFSRYCSDGVGAANTTIYSKQR